MAKKRTHVNNAKLCKCDKCGAQAHAIPDTPHRRCGGGDGTQLRPKHEGMDPANRGRWTA